MTSYDPNAAHDLRVRSVPPQPDRSAIATLNAAATLLDVHGRSSSECRAVADRLRALARQLARAKRAERGGGDDKAP